MEVKKIYYSVKEVGKILNMSEQTVRARIKDKAIPATQYVPRGRYYIHYLDIPTFIRRKPKKNGVSFVAKRTDNFGAINVPPLPPIKIDDRKERKI